MKFWPFPLLRTFDTNKKLTKLFIELSEKPVLSIEKTHYRHTVYFSDGVLTYWIANGAHAWACSGRYVTSTGSKFQWEDCMPSRYAVKISKEAFSFGSV